MKALENAFLLNLPTIVEGEPGIGKTEIIKALAEKYNCHMETIIGATVEPADVAGLPVLSADRKSYDFAAPHKMIRLVEAAKKGQRTILFFDELNSAPPAVQAVCHRIILEKVSGDLQLPNDCMMIAAINPVEMATNGYSLSAPLANRFLHLTCTVDDKDFRENFPTYWGRDVFVKNEDGKEVWALQKHFPGIDRGNWASARALVAAFIGVRGKKVLLDFPYKQEDQKAKAWPSPRTWDYASRAMSQTIKRGKGIKQLPLDMLGAALGQGAALEFATWVEHMDLPDPEKLLKDFSGFTLPERPDILYVIISSVVSLVASETNEKTKEDYWYSAWKFMKHVSLLPGASLSVITHFVKNELTRIAPKFTKGVPPEINYFAKISATMTRQ